MQRVLFAILCPVGHHDIGNVPSREEVSGHLTCKSCSLKRFNIELLW